MDSGERMGSSLGRATDGANGEDGGRVSVVVSSRGREKRKEIKWAAQAKATLRFHLFYSV